MTKLATMVEYRLLIFLAIGQKLLVLCNFNTGVNQKILKCALF